MLGWHSSVHIQPHLSEACGALVGDRHSIERAIVVAVPIEPPHQLATVCVPERNRHVLRWQVKDVDHVRSGA